MKAEFKVGQCVVLATHVRSHGALRQMVSYTVNSVSNVGTKRQPQWRYYLGGAGYVDQTDIVPA